MYKINTTRSYLHKVGYWISIVNTLFEYIHFISNSLRGETVYVNFLVSVSCSLNISIVYFCN